MAPIGDVAAQCLRFGVDPRPREECAERVSVAFREIGLKQVGDQAPATLARLEHAHESEVELGEHLSAALVNFDRSPGRFDQTRDARRSGIRR